MDQKQNGVENDDRKPNQEENNFRKRILEEKVWYDVKMLEGWKDERWEWKKDFDGFGFEKFGSYFMCGTQYSLTLYLWLIWQDQMVFHLSDWRVFKKILFIYIHLYIIHLYISISFTWQGFFISPFSTAELTRFFYNFYFVQIYLLAIF